MPWKCMTCNNSFERKQNYNRHMKSALHIKRIQSEQPMFTCDICCKQFSYKRSLINHQKLKNCGSLHKTETEIEIMKQKIESFEKERDGMKKQIALLLEKHTTPANNSTQNIETQNIQTQNTGNNNTNNTNNIETQNVIVVNSFGNENIDHLTDQIICRIIQTSPFTSVPQLIEKIHFDPEHPENHNIKITNKKMNYAEIVKNNKWITANKKKVIDDIIENSYNLLDEKYTENKDSMYERRKERFENFQNKYEEQDEAFMKNIKNDVDLILINGTNEVHK